MMPVSLESREQLETLNTGPPMANMRQLYLQRPLTRFVLADIIVLHVAPVVIPLVKVGTSEARIGRWLMVHDNTLFTST